MAQMDAERRYREENTLSPDYVLSYEERLEVANDGAKYFVDILTIAPPKEEDLVTYRISYEDVDGSILSKDIYVRGELYEVAISKFEKLYPGLDWMTLEVIKTPVE